jgi:hypothetical protein
MKVKELILAIEQFLAALEEHSELWRRSLDPEVPDYPIANEAILRAQRGWLARRLGTLRPDLDRFQFCTVMGVAGTTWDIYDSAVSNDVAIRKGHSLEAVCSQLQQALGRLDSMKPDDEFTVGAHPAQEQPQATAQPVTINLHGAQSRVNVQSSDRSTNVGHGVQSGKSPASAPNPKPNLKFLGISSPMVDWVFDVPRWLTSFHPKEDGEFECVVACFRNEVIYGKPPVRIRNARAHLKCFDIEGSEIGGGVSHAFWLGRKTAVVDLVPGTTKECVVLLVRDRDKFSVPAKTQGAHRGHPITREKFLWDKSEPPALIELNLLGPDNQFLLPPLSLELDRTANHLTYRPKQQ